MSYPTSRATTVTTGNDCRGHRDDEHVVASVIFFLVVASSELFRFVETNYIIFVLGHHERSQCRA